MNSEHSCDLKTCSCTVSRKYIGLQVSASIHADSEMLLAKSTCSYLCEICEILSIVVMTLLV